MAENEIPLKARIKAAFYEQRPNTSGPFNTQLSLAGDSDTGATFEFHIEKSTKNRAELHETIKASEKGQRSFHYRIKMELEDQDYKDMVSVAFQHIRTARLEVFLGFKEGGYGESKDAGEYAYFPSTLRFVWNLLP